MSQFRRKNVDQLIEESERLEVHWSLFATADEATKKQLIDDVAAFARVCATHGAFVSPGSADRRALRSTLEHWTSRLRSTGGVQAAGVLLADFDPEAGVVLEGKCPYPGLDAYDNGLVEVARLLERCGGRFADLIARSPIPQRSPRCAPPRPSAGRSAQVPSSTASRR